MSSASCKALRPSLISYNVALRCAPSWPDGMASLLAMASQGLRGDVYSCCALLGRCPWPRALYSLGRPESVVLVNEAMTELKAWPLSLQLLTQLPVNRLHVDVIVRNRGLTSLQRAEKWQEAISLLLNGMKGNTVSFNACLSACEGAGELQQALNLLEFMDLQAVRADVVSFSAILSACCKTVRWERALEELSTMVDRSISPDLIASNAAMAACAEATEWQQSLWMLGRASKSDCVSFNSVLKGLEKALEWQIALHLVAEMRRCDVRASLVTYNTLLSACQKSSHWQFALQLFGQMSGLLCDVITYNSLLAACRRGSLWQEALHLWSIGERDVVGLMELFGSCVAAGAPASGAFDGGGAAP